MTGNLELVWSIQTSTDQQRRRITSANMVPLTPRSLILTGPGKARVGIIQPQDLHHTSGHKSQPGQHRLPKLSPVPYVRRRDQAISVARRRSCTSAPCTSANARHTTYDPGRGGAAAGGLDAHKLLLQAVSMISQVYCALNQLSTSMNPIV